MEPETHITYRLAHRTAKGIARKTMRHLQTIEATLSGDDTVLGNLWDEICVQVQDEHSFYWDAYVETVHGVIKSYLRECDALEQESVAIQTNCGQEWLYEQRGKGEKHVPLCEEEMVGWIANEHLFEIAGDWSNRRIRAYLDSFF